MKISKAEVLYKLRNEKKFKSIPKLKIFKLSDYRKNPNKIINEIKKNFKTKIAIRSSAISEDGNFFSNAGKYRSHLNVDVKDDFLLNTKLEDVTNSLKKNNKNLFFVQEMASNIIMSGVVLTYSLTSNIKSYNINYHLGKDTSNVTSGLGNNFNFYYIENNKYKVADRKFQIIINKTKQLEKIFKTDKLDIEFAIDNKKNFILLQVRKQIIKNKIVSKEKIINNLFHLEKKINKINSKKPNLIGSKTFFSVMTDWNPAEMIGTKPKPLALSLYKNLITNNIWAKSREVYGYQNVQPNQLMTTFYGTPFIDIRIDFNSFIPKNLNQSLKKKLIDFYLDKFEKNKFLHDKVEFELIYSCFHFDIKKTLNKDLPKKFTKRDISELTYSLKVITNNALNINLDKDLKLIKRLKKTQKEISNSKMYEIDKIFWLVKNCKQYGTLPFAGLARCGFIGTQILNSLVSQNIIDKDDYNNFFKSLNLITSKIINDRKKLSKNNFLNNYGHIRPDMYEITNKNYKEGYKQYFKLKKNETIKKSIFKLDKEKKLKIKKLLFKNKLNFKNTEFLFRRISQSIILREESKFIFSKSLDMIFKNIKKLFKRLKLNLDDASYVNINSILSFYDNLDNSNLRKILSNEIKNNKKQYILNNSIKVPSVITKTRDLFINNENSKINFVTNGTVSSKLLILNNNQKSKLRGKIVLIENADPGYDYIFDQKIKGLITKFGGINSHMSIRCSELSIPAAIGIGESIFDKIKDKNYITIDCTTKKIY